MRRKASGCSYLNERFSSSVLMANSPRRWARGGVDVERLPGDFVLLVGGHRAEGAHIVEAVGHLDEHHAYILRHRQEELAEVLGLGRRLVAEDAAGDFGEPGHDLGDLLAEVLLDVLDGVVGVLDHVVEQRGADRGRAEADFLRCDFRDGDRVENVWLAGAAPYPLVGLLGEVEGALDYFDLLAVVRREVAVEHFAESVVYYAVFFGGSERGCHGRGGWG